MGNHGTQGGGKRDQTISRVLNNPGGLKRKRGEGNHSNTGRKGGRKNRIQEKGVVFRQRTPKSANLNKIKKGRATNSGKRW